jgi:hypothetical protein
MGTVGLRELRQDASELVRRAERGEEIDGDLAGVERLIEIVPV